MGEVSFKLSYIATGRFLDIDTDGLCNKEPVLLHFGSATWRICKT
jgi:hypothetical protein